MATHSSILAWKVPWTEEYGGCYSPWGRRESDRLSTHGLAAGLKQQPFISHRP